MKYILTLGMILVCLSAHAAEDGPFVYDDQDKRDPFWALVSSSGLILNYDQNMLITDLSLEGIIEGANGQGLAIINGNIVKTNDVIGEFTVVAIDSNTVTLRKGQQTFTLNYNKEE